MKCRSPVKDHLRHCGFFFLRNEMREFRSRLLSGPREFNHGQISLSKLAHVHSLVADHPFTRFRLISQSFPNSAGEILPNNRTHGREQTSVADATQATHLTAPQEVRKQGDSSRIRPRDRASKSCGAGPAGTSESPPGCWARVILESRVFFAPASILPAKSRRFISPIRFVSADFAEGPTYAADCPRRSHRESSHPD